MPPTFQNLHDQRQCRSSNVFLPAHSWWGTLNDLPMDFQVGNAERRSTQIAITATIPGYPTSPLGGIQNSSMLSHNICHSIATPMMTVNIDIQIITAGIPSRFDVNLIPYWEHALFSVMVTATRFCVKCGAAGAVSIVFCEIQFGTTWCRTARIAIAANLAWESDICVVVHSAVST